MKPVIFVAIDSKYTHTNPAVRSIAVFARKNGVTADIRITEYTVNQRADVILDELYNHDGGVYLFSCYIWNIHLVEDVARELHKIRPHALLLAGGPEAGWDGQGFLVRNPVFAGVFSGEGELSVTEFLMRWQRGEDWSDIAGVTVPGEDSLWAQKQSPRIWAGAQAGSGHWPPRAGGGNYSPRIDDGHWPFPYPDLDNLTGRNLYYESMRGCPFSCSYCLSSTISGVRFRSMDVVHKDLQRFLDAKVRRVKFADRTFNCDKSHAMAVWRYLSEHDNGVTNFHFELAGDLLDDEMLSFLSGVRPGLFQFEIGVQSTNPDTLREISRRSNLELLFSNVTKLRKHGNIHLHLDLIAGLPLEDFDSFAASFNQVYSLHPHQLQLGFLKLLGGCAISEKREQYVIEHRARAPYEVLSTKWLSYEELAILKSTEHALEIYYNTGRFQHLIGWLEKHFPDAFSLYRALGDLYRELGWHLTPPSKLDLYELPAKLMHREGIPLTEHAQWLCKLDLIRHERPGALPSWVTVDGFRPHYEAIRGLLADAAWRGVYMPEYDGVSPTRLERLIWLELFPFHPITGEQVPHAVLGDYRKKDLDGRARTEIFPWKRSG